MSILAPPLDAVSDGNEQVTDVPSGAGLSSPVPDTRHNNHFNLMRLALAALVMLSHSPAIVDGNRSREPLTRIFGTHTIGALAVDGFFVLSGYLIVQSWMCDPNVWRFLKKRVLRIYPAYIVAWIISALVVGWIGSKSPTYFSDFKYETLLTRMPVLNPPKIPQVFEGTYGRMVNASMWTIKYEFECYLIVAAVGVCGIVARRRAWLLFAAGVMIYFIAGKLVQGQAILGYEFDEKNRPGLYSFLMFFTAGGCFYLFKDRIPYRPHWVLLASVIFLASMFHRTLALLGLATVGAYVFFWLAFVKLPFKGPITIKSDISYGLYLYGWPVQKLLTWYIPSMGPWVLFPVSTLLAAGCGWISWKVVEAPFLRLKPQAGKPAAAPMPPVLQPTTG